MAMTKTLETLIERAVRKGIAVKRVRECNIMGGNPHSKDFVEQWRVEFQYGLDQNGSVTQSWKVYHYEVLIFSINNNCAGGWVLLDYYGESTTDAQALNGLCRHFGINKSFSYGKRKGFVAS